MLRRSLLQGDYQPIAKRGKCGDPIGVGGDAVGEVAHTLGAAILVGIVKDTTMPEHVVDDEDAACSQLVGDHGQGSGIGLFVDIVDGDQRDPGWP